jgi:2-iminoacetate synthase
MFSRFFSSESIWNMLGGNAPARAEVEAILAKSTKTLSDMARLLRAEGHSDLVVSYAHSVRQKTWQKSLFLMPPLYISNGVAAQGGCMDHCVYCPWRNDNVPPDKLRRLSIEEIKAEAQCLLEMGYEDVELVSATDPYFLKGDGPAAAVRSAKMAGAKHIGVNFFPLATSDHYSDLRDAGCTYCIVWQETYDTELYQKLHPRGPKSNMAYRLDAHDRACQGGICITGLGFLGGLADWRYEALSALQHGEYLCEEYGSKIIWGMPRWKSGHSGETRAPVEYSDLDYELVGAVYSLFMPNSLPWFSTREDFSLSSRAASGGGCLFTLTCSTEVGGYTRRDGFAQFPVFTRSLEEGRQWLTTEGFKVLTTLPWPIETTEKVTGLVAGI